MAFGSWTCRYSNSSSEYLYSDLEFRNTECIEFDKPCRVVNWINILFQLCLLILRDDSWNLVAPTVVHVCHFSCKDCMIADHVQRLAGDSKWRGSTRHNSIQSVELYLSTTELVIFLKSRDRGSFYEYSWAQRLELETLRENGKDFEGLLSFVPAVAARIKIDV